MKMPTFPARATSSFRHAINGIDISVFGIGLSVLTALIVWGLLASAYLPARYDLKTGDVASDRIIAPRTLTYENEAETERRQQQAREKVTEVYAFDAAVLSRVSDRISRFFQDAGRIIYEEQAAAAAASQPYDPAKAAARIQALEEGPDISEATLVTLASLDAARQGEVSKDVLDSVQRILQGNVTKTSLATDRDRLDAVLQTMTLAPGELEAAAEIGGAFLEPNYSLNEEQTNLAREEAAAKVQPVINTIRSGETIISTGQVVTADTMATLEALGLTEEEGKYGTIAGIALLVAIEALFLVLYINRFEKRIRESRSLEFIAATLLILFAALGRVSVISPLTPLIVPLAALGILGTILLQTRMSLIMVALATANIAIVGGSDPQYILVAIIGGATAVFLVTNVTQRRDLLRAGLISGAVITATAAGASQFSQNSLTELVDSTLWGAANGMLAIVVSIGLLSVYELALNLSTPLKLLELADPTRPMLKELMMKAPGTYNHSILMGNIAETAAESIGANTLLARVGAYYHDIGKLNRPEYFIENQFHIKNPHDRLTPSLSRLAITAHVRDGVRLAEEEGLPPEIIDIIREHHGTTVLSYFYHKAQKTTREGQVDEEAFRYAGKKPASKESAIVMMADSVEAAVRSLRAPTVRSIKSTIRDIFAQRLRDGQLSESRMTFGDMEKVRAVFEKSLQGFGATRIAYPSRDEEPGESGTHAGAPRPETWSGSPQ